MRKFLIRADRGKPYPIEAETSFDAWEWAFAAHPHAGRVEVEPDKRERVLQLAPWPDFAGQPIHEGDTIEHPVSGQRGVVLYWPHEREVSDRWRVIYEDGPVGVVSRLGLQIGDKGQARVVDPTCTPRRIPHIPAPASWGNLLRSEDARWRNVADPL